MEHHNLDFNKVKIRNLDGYLDKVKYKWFIKTRVV